MKELTLTQQNQIVAILENRRAILLIKKRKSEKAIQVVDDLLNAGYDYHYFHNTKGIAYLYLNEPYKALINFKRAIRLDSVISNYYVNLYLACSQLADKQPHRIDQALEAANRAIEYKYVKDNPHPKEAKEFLEDLILFCNKCNKHEDAAHFFDILIGYS